MRWCATRAHAVVRADRRERDHVAAQRGGPAGRLSGPRRARASSPTTTARVPPLRGAERRLVVFLGSTIGNFVPPADAAFLRAVAARAAAPVIACCSASIWSRHGECLHAAYNDAAGVTAEFNRNVLRVINRELDADFDPAALRARRALRPRTPRRSRCTCALASRSRCVSPRSI